jgi:hypothetical protein
VRQINAKTKMLTNTSLSNSSKDITALVEEREKRRHGEVHGRDKSRTPFFDCLFSLYLDDSDEDAVCVVLFWLVEVIAGQQYFTVIKARKKKKERGPALPANGR